MHRCKPRKRQQPRLTVTWRGKVVGHNPTGLHRCPDASAGFRRRHGTTHRDADKFFAISTALLASERATSRECLRSDLLTAGRVQVRVCGKQALTVVRSARWRWREAAFEDNLKNGLCNTATTEHRTSISKVAGVAAPMPAKCAKTVPTPAGAVVSSHDTAVAQPSSANQPESAQLAEFCRCSGACNSRGEHKYWKEEGNRLQRCTQAPMKGSKYCFDCACSQAGCTRPRYKGDTCKPCRFTSPTNYVHVVVSKLARYMPLPADITAYMEHVNITTSSPVVAIIAARLWEPWAVTAFVKSCGNGSSPAVIKRGLLAAITATRKDVMTQLHSLMLRKIIWALWPSLIQSKEACVLLPLALSLALGHQA